MAGPIVTVENSLIGLIKAALGARVKGVKSLPGGWDEGMLKRLIVNAPAVYVAFMGGPVIGDRRIGSRWGVYAVTSDPCGEAARRVGTKRSIGAYEILERVVPAVDEQTIDNIGSFELSGSIDNLFTGTIAKQNLTIYEAQFTIPLQFDRESDWSTLDDFITFHADFDLVPVEGNIDGSMDVDLEQIP